MYTIAMDRTDARSARTVAKTAIGSTWRAFALTLFTVWLLVVGIRHEPWFDESQAWLLARDNGFWQLLAHRVRYEGTPGLWHVVLWLAIRAGLPFQWFFTIPMAFSVAGAAVIVWRAPFPAWLSIAFLASYFFGYQYAVIARSYCLDLLLFPLAAMLFARRVDRPLAYALVVGLIANANTHGFLVGAMLGLELAWQCARHRTLRRPDNAVALAICGGLCLFALFCAWQPSDNDYLHPGFRASPVITLTLYLCHAFVDHIDVWSWDMPGKYESFCCVALSLVLLYCIAKLILAGRNAMIHFSVLGVLLLFSALVYAKTWHSGILFLSCLFVLWVEWDNCQARADRRNLMVIIAVVLGLQAVQTIRTGLWDIEHVYSPGRQAATALIAYRVNHPHARIDGYGDFAFNVQPWLDGNPFGNYHHGDRRMSYVLWDKKEPWMAGAWEVGTHLDFWHKVLADRPDLIVASPLNRLNVGGYRADLVSEACTAGYVVIGAFDGTMVWRGVYGGRETLYLFERRETGACKPAASPDRSTVRGSTN
jgi:hypothetical protein